MVINRFLYLSFRRPTALAYLILCTLPCFAILIAGSKVMSLRLISLRGSPIVVSFFHAPAGSLKRHIFVLNSPCVAQIWFMTLASVKKNGKFVIFRHQYSSLNHKYIYKKCSPCFLSSLIPKYIMHNQFILGKKNPVLHVQNHK